MALDEQQNPRSVRQPFEEVPFTWRENAGAALIVLAVSLILYFVPKLFH
jgi:hypothetical protein